MICEAKAESTYRVRGGKCTYGLGSAYVDNCLCSLYKEDTGILFFYGKLEMYLWDLTIRLRAKECI